MHRVIENFLEEKKVRAVDNCSCACFFFLLSYVHFSFFLLLGYSTVTRQWIKLFRNFVLFAITQWIFFLHLFDVWIWKRLYISCSPFLFSSPICIFTCFDDLATFHFGALFSTATVQRPICQIQCTIQDSSYCFNQFLNIFHSIRRIKMFNKSFCR